MIFKASTTTIIIIFSFQVLFDEFICTRWAPYIMPILQLYTFFFYYKYNILTIKVISARQGHGWVVGRQVFHVETERFRIESSSHFLFNRELITSDLSNYNYILCVICELLHNKQIITKCSG